MAKARTNLSILQRPQDLIIVLLYCYFLFSCIFIERFYCEAPLQEDDSDFLLKATYDYSIQYNPLFLSRPEWLRVATCISAYVLGFGYAIGVITFLKGIELLRIPLLMFCSFKFYALILYYYIEIFGSMPVPDIWMFLAPEGAYFVGLFLTLYRLRTSHPFSIPNNRKQKSS